MEELGNEITIIGLSSLTLLGLLKTDSYRYFKFLFGSLMFNFVVYSLVFLLICNNDSKFSDIMAAWTHRDCKEFKLSDIVDSFNIFFRDLGSFYASFDNFILKTCFDLDTMLDIRFYDGFSLLIWYQLYKLWPPSPSSKALKSAQRKKLKSSSRNTKRDSEQTNVDPDWIWHSCLYGHKDTLKKIFEKYPNEFKPNFTTVHGNTALHLGVFGDHLPIVQVLISKFGKDINFSIRNNDGLNPLDLALLRKNNAIIKLLLKHTRPEVSSLITAINTFQHEFVQQFCEHLSKTLAKHPDLLIPLQRFVELCKEIEAKMTPKDRKEVCKTNVEVYKNHICTHLKKYFAYAINEEDYSDDVDKVTVDLESYNDKETKDILSEFECPVCFEVMNWPKRIYACSNDHYICSICLTDPKVLACPLCREDFILTKPGLRHTSERFLAKILSQKH